MRSITLFMKKTLLTIVVFNFIFLVVSCSSDPHPDENVGRIVTGWRIADATGQSAG